MLKNKLLKNKKYTLLALFLLTVAAGLYYPVSKILLFEFPSAPPAVYRFRAELYDPYDPFRGRYVALRIPAQRLSLSRDIDTFAGGLYGVLEQDGDGQARVVDISDKLVPGKDCLRLDDIDKIPEGYGADGSSYFVYTIYFPFKRYYMNEKLAPEADVAVNTALGNNASVVIAAKIFADGNFTVSELEIDGVPILEFLKLKRREMEERKRDAAEETELAVIE